MLLVFRTIGSDCLSETHCDGQMPLKHEQLAVRYEVGQIPCEAAPASAHSCPEHFTSKQVRIATNKIVRIANPAGNLCILKALGPSHKERGVEPLSRGLGGASK